VVGLLIIARLGSTRLERKHLIEVNGKTFVEWLVERYRKEFSKEILQNQVKIFIATSVKIENRQFGLLFKDKIVSIFYGNDENIPLRQLECALANDLESIISIDGDDILCSTKGARTVFDNLNNGYRMVQTQGLPLGMNVSGYKTAFLQEALSLNNSLKLETGWGRIFDKDAIETIKINGFENSENLRMTLDYQEDALFFHTVISEIGDEIVSIDDKKLVTTILENGWNKLNDNLNEEYWNNFNKSKQSES